MPDIDHTDLNRRVAAAVGWVSEEHNPAREWHDAMIAAERFGLFTKHRRVLGKYHNGDWAVGEDGPCVEECDARHEHGPTCISLAILAIAEAEHEPA